MMLISTVLKALILLQVGAIYPDFGTLLHPEVLKPLDYRELPVAAREELQAAVADIRDDEPDPLSEIHYEGLLDNNPSRMETVRHLEDMDKLALFYWHHAFFGDAHSLQKMMDFSLAWAKMFQPTGNPINENKLLPIVYAYPFVEPHMKSRQQHTMEEWLREMARAEIGNERVPLNNWETKRINLVGTIGLLLEDDKLVSWAEEKAAYYVENALFADGSSADIRQRDALSYHVSGLKPLLQFLITLEQETGRGKDFFYRETADGASVARSLDFVLPYAKGEKIYRQWENSKVRLDQERAAAGLEKYQPGVAYDPQKAYETMALASYFDDKYRMDQCGLPLCQITALLN
ncbi:Alginate lyase [Cyclobacterium lianum]|uniref:Alginate lyase n=1 Tax=Cyclobacterium lianum TaxID=388280 RepID=A0A1M7QTI3_9BACT|nr:alginate lyase family protein [Cyclobacterium lianum]SHN35163.1 Alginate lyase [Cyclobacterium lianum]